MEKKYNLNKIILKSYEYLYKYKNSNKFNIKKNDNLNHLYLLYIQNNYNFNFDFDKKKYTNSKKFTNCLNSLYEFKSKNKKSLNNLLFDNDELLGNIFFLDKKKDFDLDNYLLKLEEKTYSLEYVDSKIEFLDYYGKAINNTEVIKCGFCLLLVNERFPDIKISKKLQKNIVKALIKIIEPKDKKISYTNTQALMILYLLNKQKNYIRTNNFINLLCSQQIPNGKWNNGYSSYFIKNSESLDAMHTCFALIILLEHQTIIEKERLEDKRKKMKITPSISGNLNNNRPSESPGFFINDNSDDNSSDDNSSDDNEESNNNIDNNEEESRPKKMSNNEKNNEIIKAKKDIIEKFDNIYNDNNDKYVLDFNFYNISLLLILILLLINYSKITKYIKKLKI
jgi:hypothetical protein